MKRTARALGLALGVENLTFDFRYWDTNIGDDAGGVCAGAGQDDPFRDRSIAASLKLLILPPGTRQWRMAAVSMPGSLRSVP